MVDMFGPLGQQATHLIFARRTGNVWIVKGFDNAHLFLFQFFGWGHSEAASTAVFCHVLPTIIDV